MTTEQRSSPQPLQTAEAMEQVRQAVLRRLGKGGAEAGAQLIERTLSDAIERRDYGRIMMLPLLAEEEHWRLDEPLRLSSHRGVLGQGLIFVKRWLLLPLNRWLYSHVEEKFRRQQLTNELLLALVEELLEQQADLSRAVSGLQERVGADADGARPGSSAPSRK